MLHYTDLFWKEDERQICDRCLTPMRAVLHRDQMSCSKHNVRNKWVLISSKNLTSNLYLDI